VVDQYSPGGLAIYLDHDNVIDFVVTYNTITDARKAIGFGTLSGGKIECNLITGSTTYDIEIRNASVATVNYNSLTGMVKNFDTATLDAEYNRWGDCDPSDQVEGPVDYIPYICGLTCKMASYNEAKFTFMPVPGDLTGDGLVSVKDLTAIAAKYCQNYTMTMCDDNWADAETTAMGYKTRAERWRALYYFDFNEDRHIDIFDIIVVSKNWERSCPF